jgi:hypothetical protein
MAGFLVGVCVRRRKGVGSTSAEVEEPKVMTIF